MTALATRVAREVDDPTGPSVPQTERSDERPFDPANGPTLEDVILGVWEELVADGWAECPVCGSAISLPHGCEGCGSALS